MQIREKTPWILRPFGSLRNFFALTTLFMISRAVDMATTYYALNSFGGDFSSEGNWIYGESFTHFGFFPVAIFNIFLSPVLIVVISFILFYFRIRFKNATERDARRITTLLFIVLSAFSFVFGLWNLIVTWIF